jgi:hypothetical protein
MATWDLREAVNASAQELPPEVDEFELAGLEKAPSRRVKPMRVARSPIQFECVYLNSRRFPGDGPTGSADVVFGRVVAVHVADEFIAADGRVDVVKIRPIARMGEWRGQAAEHRGLAGAARAEQRDELARRHPQADLAAHLLEHRVGLVGGGHEAGVGPGHQCAGLVLRNVRQRRLQLARQRRVEATSHPARSAGDRTPRRPGSTRA